jgi:hypothetical protein
MVDELQFVGVAPVTLLVNSASLNCRSREELERVGKEAVQLKLHTRIEQVGKGAGFPSRNSPASNKLDI